MALTNAQRLKVADAVSRGLSYADAGALVGVHKRTVTRLMSDPAMRARAEGKTAEMLNVVGPSPRTTDRRAGVDSEPEPEPDPEEPSRQWIYLPPDGPPETIGSRVRSDLHLLAAGDQRANVSLIFTRDPGRAAGILADLRDGVCPC
jgi:hypothetical protein